ncbi:hypothetical protein P8452_64415 [Trifolium repens]|nr:hypothetical protein P8452_64415 [Trifolium repens]
MNCLCGVCVISSDCVLLVLDRSSLLCFSRVVLWLQITLKIFQVVDNCIQMQLIVANSSEMLIMQILKFNGCGFFMANKILIIAIVNWDVLSSQSVISHKIADATKQHTNTISEFHIQHAAQDNFSSSLVLTSIILAPNYLQNASLKTSSSAVSQFVWIL